MRLSSAGVVVARTTVEVALSCDHRVVYGAEAARFLQRLRHLLENPVSLVVDLKEETWRRSTSGRAVRSALDEELERDERVILFGEDVAIAGGVFATTPGLYEKYGPRGVFDTPISELAMTGAAYGAAITGLRPVLEIMFGDFLALSMDSLINQSTKYWFLTGERQRLPTRDSLGRRRRRPLRRHPLADARLLADGDHRAEDRRTLDPGRRQGSPQGRDPRREPRHLLRAQAALRDQGRGRPRASRSSSAVRASSAKART